MHSQKIRECSLHIFEPPSHFSKGGGGNSSRSIGRSSFEGRKYPHFGRIKVQGVRRQPVSSPDGSHGRRRDKDEAGIMRRPFDGEFYYHCQSFRQHSLSSYCALLWRVRRFPAFLKSTARSPYRIFVIHQRRRRDITVYI